MKVKFGRLGLAVCASALALSHAAWAGPPIPATAVTTAAAPGTPVTFSVALPLQNEDGLKALIAAQGDPTSSSYHQFLTPDAFNARFGPTQAAKDAVIAAMQAQGFAPVDVEGRTIKFSGTAGGFAGAFATNLVQVTLPSGATHMVATSAPVLPQALAQAGAIVTGFSGLPRLHALAVPAPGVDPENRNKAAGAYWFTDLKQAYDYPAYNSTLPNGQRPDGTGVQVAVLMSNDILDTDVVAMFNHENFAQNGGGTVQPVIHMPVNGGAPFDINASFEASLDVQQVLGGAPGSTVTLVNIPDLSDKNIHDGYNYIVNAKNSSGAALYQLVNSSFGGCEAVYTAAYNGGDDYTYLIRSYEALFEQGNAEGITFVASSGDSGGLECPEVGYFYGKSTARFTPSVSFPADSPSVTAVGGGNLITTADGTLNSAYVSENALGDPEVPRDPYGLGVKVSGGYWGAGGGISAVYARPAYQTLVNTGNTTARTLPDVGMQVGGCPGGESVLPCGPNRSAAIVYDGNGFAGGGAFGVIGTSVSSPEFVGALALFVQRYGPLGNANYYLYSKAALQNAGQGPFYHRLLTGFDGKYTDKTPGGGYNYLAGNGTPDVRALLGFTDLPAAGVPQTATNP